MTNDPILTPDVLKRLSLYPEALVTSPQPVKTSYSDLSPGERYLYDTTAKGSSRNMAQSRVMNNARMGVGVLEGSEMERQAALAPLQRQNDDQAAQDWGMSVVAEWEATNVDSKKVKTPEEEWDAILKFAESRPDKPDVAKLKDPSSLQLIIAGILAVARPDAALQIMAQPFLKQQREKASEQERLDMDFAQKVKAHDQELELMLQDYKIKGTAREKESDRQAEIERTRITQEGLGERATVAARGKADATLAKLLTDPDTPPSSIKAFAESIGTYSAEEVSNIVKEAEDLRGANIGKTKAQTKGIEAGTRLTESKILTEEERRGEIDRKNRFFDATYDDEVKIVAARLKEYGVKFDIADLQRQKLEAELPYVDDEIIAGLAATRARTAYTYRLIDASKEKNAKVNDGLDLEEEFLADDLTKDRQSLKEIEGKYTEAMAEFNAYKGSDDDETAKYADSQYQMAQQYQRARNLKSKDIQAAEDALRDLRRRARNVASEEGNTPLKVVPKFKQGPIGK